MIISGVGPIGFRENVIDISTFQPHGHILHKGSLRRSFATEVFACVPVRASVCVCVFVLSTSSYTTHVRLCSMTLCTILL